MNKLSLAFITISALGIILAIVLSYEYITADFTVCNISSFFSCGAVAASPYSRLFGIPMYIIGLIWFPLLFLVGLITSSFGKNEINIALSMPLLLLGDIFTVYLWYDQLVLIGKLCPFCISLYLVNYLLTILAVLSYKR